MDVTLEPEKRVVQFEDEDRVHAFVAGIVTRFLEEQGFLHPVDSREGERSPPHSARMSLDDEPVGLGVVRLGLGRFRRVPSPALPELPARGVVEAETPATVEGCQSTPPPQPAEAESAPVPPQTPARHVEEVEIDIDGTEPIRWTDPSSQQVYLINPRTGNSWRPGERPAATCTDLHPAVNLPPTPSERLLVDRSYLRRTEEVEGDAAPAPWVAAALQGWEDPVFPSAPQPIPTLQPIPDHNPLIRTGAHSPPPNRPPWASNSISRTRVKAMDAFFHQSSQVEQRRPLGELSPSRLTKEMLGSARFIAQVDRKFLLVALPPDEDEEGAGRGKGPTLIIVDQHAADERVRVEGFLDELAGRVARGEAVEREALQPPVGVVISRDEAATLRAGAGKVEQFARWGVDILLEPDDAGLAPTGEEPATDYVQVFLSAVPSVVCARLKVDPRLQQELVRSYLAHPVTGLPANTGEGQGTAAAALRDCPPILVELVNSLACRGAIMFNDGESVAPEKCVMEAQLTVGSPYRRTDPSAEHRPPSQPRPDELPVPVRARQADDSAARQPPRCGQVSWCGKQGY